MRYFQKILGERLYLSSVNPEDAELYTKWINDREVSLWLGLHASVMSQAKERQILDGMATGDGFNFAMILRDGDRLLGNISLMGRNPIDRSAELGIFIGEAEDREKGYGAEAIRLLLGFGFNTLGLHNIMLHVNADNARAIACYKKCGFREYGRRRESLFRDGHFVDTVSMDILDREFAEK